ncbi:DNA repair protein RadA [Anoxybacter fermentans]|uniref:DNA repair protein RadA n=1 Tax=Anoxybacter fermentans TaxID=1323375 RepID=A0A3Q9HSC8_9FIRM|nr:DNA repair protein RadA [Anoxybacter fermentans]AZR74686.1 DNA repair protein RadA [Anoxybacter fermentans]
MAKKKTRFICQKCGYEAIKWYGQCPDCKEWNTLVEEIVTSQQRKERPTLVNPPQSIRKLKTDRYQRLKTLLGELDRVLGGGIVPGSLILIGGDPGIGKSTLLLQVADRIARDYGKVLYVTGEESGSQVRMRAERLKTMCEKLYVQSENNIFTIEEGINKINPIMVIVDSIQTIFNPDLSSAPGSISQVRETSSHLMRIAKERGIPIFVVGHVTKEGSLAGPRVLEHMVDTVLYFEGDRHHSYRILRAVKNRFGSTNEIGIFEMQQTGLIEVPNPSEVFLSERPQGASGSVVIPSVEGSRPILIELQALVSSANFATPQRMTAGVDRNRVALVLAVLEKKIGMYIQSQDVYINVVGGVRLSEPALDLGIAVACASSYREKPIDSKVAIVGEVGLAGEIRAVQQIEARVKEAKKLGFTRVIMPWSNYKAMDFDPEMELVGVKDLNEALSLLLGGE